MSKKPSDPMWDWIEKHPNRDEPRFPFNDVGSDEDAGADKATADEKKQFRETAITRDVDLRDRILIRGDS